MAARRSAVPALRSVVLAPLSCGFAANLFIALPTTSSGPDPVSALQ